MSIRDYGFVVGIAVLAVACGGAKTDTKSPDGSLSGPVTDVQRLYPLNHDTVFSYQTTIEDGSIGVYVVEVGRPRADMAELKVAGRIERRYVSADGVQVPSGGYILHAPLTDGAEWQGMFGKVKVKSMSRSIKVPAGDFGNCVETLEEAETTSFSKEQTTVFCPGIGMVFCQITGEENGVKVSQKLELKTFGPRYVAGIGQ